MDRTFTADSKNTSFITLALLCSQTCCTTIAWSSAWSSDGPRIMPVTDPELCHRTAYAFRRYGCAVSPARGLSDASRRPLAYSPPVCCLFGRDFLLPYPPRDECTNTPPLMVSVSFDYTTWRIARTSHAPSPATAPGRDTAPPPPPRTTPH